jgi:hypothetical protein
MVLGGRPPGRVGHCQETILFYIGIVQFEFPTKISLRKQAYFCWKGGNILCARKQCCQFKKIKNVVGKIGSFHGSQCPRMEFLALVR